MKRSVRLSILFFFLLLLSSCNQNSEHTHTNHDHVAFSSSIQAQDCLLCSDQSTSPLSDYFGQLNLGIIDLNTFTVEPVPIFAYTPSSDIPANQPRGTVQFKSPVLGDSQVTMMIHSDRGYAQISVEQSPSKIHPEEISSHLCPACLDAFSSEYFVEDDPVSLAVVDFSRRVISPLIPCRPNFILGDYLIDCDFEADGGIDLLLVYRPSRFT